jgi:hypothetical protein
LNGCQTKKHLIIDQSSLAIANNKIDRYVLCLLVSEMFVLRYSRYQVFLQFNGGLLKSVLGLLDAERQTGRFGFDGCG